MDIKNYKNDYESDGVIRVRGLFSADEMGAIKEALKRYETEVVPGLPEGDFTMEKDGKSVRNLWRMEQHDRFFAELAERPELLELVGQLVNGEPVLKAVETFNKPAQTGSGVPAHQDNAYFCQTPPDVLTVWIAVDPVTRANGPVTYLRGSHRAGLIEHKPSGVAGNSMGLSRLPDRAAYAEWEGLLEFGDALLHHCETVHYSSPNRTDQPRRGLLMVFGGAHTEDAPELRKRYSEAS